MKNEKAKKSKSTVLMGHNHKLHFDINFFFFIGDLSFTQVLHFSSVKKLSRDMFVNVSFQKNVLSSLQLFSSVIKTT